MKIFKFILFFVLLLIIVVVLGLGYLGFIPAISKLMGTNKPKDLGMEFSQENYDEGLAKSKVEIKELPVESVDTISYEGSHEVKDSFSDEELTSHASKNNWSYYPISDIQVRINDDDSCEVSGIIKLSQIGDFLSAMNVSQADFEKALKEVNIPLVDLPFYAKGMGTASNNSLSIDVSNFEVGRFPVPTDIINKYEGQLASFGESVMKNIPGFSVKEARFENNSIYFDGNLPDAEMTKR